MQDNSSQELFADAFAEMANDPEALAEIRELEGTLGDGLESDQSTF